MGDVPADHPLKLENVCLYPGFRNLESLLPHIRSLKSLSWYQYSALDIVTNLWPTLYQAKIFPAAVMGYATTDFMQYLRAHPKVVSLSFFARAGTANDNWFTRNLARHTNTLEALGMGLTCYCDMDAESQIVFAQLSSLKRLVVYGDSWYDYRGLQMVSNMHDVLRITAQVHKQAVVVFDHKDLFKACVVHCHASPDVFVRSLAGRIVYDPDATPRSMEWVG
ncbi:hypothetical protein AX17_006916 [Amanita inopinata Kibby_2008]|nr:hypothetical protein AX17_006916 [Amanita inopinata Kibby_2008]